MIAKTGFVSSAMVWAAAGCAAGGGAPRAPGAEPAIAVSSPALRGASEMPWPAPTVVAAPALRTQTRPLPHDIAQLRAARCVRARQPGRSLANARAPTLIIHGENDSRVPFVNGQILYRALRDRGVDVTFWAYPREPHGFQEPAHTEHFLELWGAFFDHQLTAGSGK